MVVKGLNIGGRKKFQKIDKEKSGGVEGREREG
jgi:hypothetical protein